MKIRRAGTTRRLEDHQAPRRTRNRQKKRQARRAYNRAIVSESSVDGSNLKNSIGLVMQAKEGKLGEPLSEVSDLKRINETEMYAAYTHHKLSQKDPALAEEFLTRVQQQTGAYKEERGSHLFFKASDRVMRDFVRKKRIRKRDYKEIKLEAFGKSQFDSDRTRISSEKLESLKDGDTAVRAVKTALNKAEENQKASNPEFQVFRAHEAKISRQKFRDKKRAGKLGLTPANSDGETVNMEGIPEGFLWKPKSEGDGKLVVLLPSGWTGTASGVKILSSDGRKVIEAGRFTSVANGFRQHYRFDKSGGSYPDGAIVEVTFTDGSKGQIKMGETSGRNE